MINRNLALRFSDLLSLTTVFLLVSGFSAQAKPLVLDNNKIAVDLSAESLTQFSQVFLIKNSYSKPETVSTTSVPLPGTAATSATDLAPDLNESASVTTARKMAQRLSDYMGIGGDIGLSNHKTALGGGGLAILDRTGLAKLGNSVNLSLHNAEVIFGNRTATSMLALTLETPIKDKLSRKIVVAPFLGGGVLLRKTGGSQKVAPLLSGGVDIPLSRDFTVTVRVNAGFLSEDTEVGLLLGVGYNFNLFGRR